MCPKKHVLTLGSYEFVVCMSEVLAKENAASRSGVDMTDVDPKMRRIERKAEKMVSKIRLKQIENVSTYLNHDS